MKVWVPTPALGSVAARALEMEGVPLAEMEMDAQTAYGELWAGLWDEGADFVICEHDVVPWPGAVEKLANCPEPWCTHAYPLHEGNVTTSFGIGKYRPAGKAPPSWRVTNWMLLDGQVIPHLRFLYHEPHIHIPPVAHARSVLAS